MMGAAVPTTASPASIVFEMRRLEPFLDDAANTERYRVLGHALMQSEGSTALDALAFLNIAMPLLSHALAALPDDPAAAASKSALSIAAGYVTRAADALEAHSQMPDTKGGREASTFN